MRGSEGGIPYRQQRRPLTRHWAPTIGARPVCGTTAWRYITTPNAADITCQDCKRAVEPDPIPSNGNDLEQPLDTRNSHQ